MRATSEDLLAMRRHDTTNVVTVRRPLKRHRAGNKVAPFMLMNFFLSLQCVCVKANKWQVLNEEAHMAASTDKRQVLSKEHKTTTCGH